MVHPFLSRRQTPFREATTSGTSLRHQPPAPVSGISLAPQNLSASIWNVTRPRQITARYLKPDFQPQPTSQEPPILIPYLPSFLYKIHRAPDISMRSIPSGQSHAQENSRAMIHHVTCVDRPSLG